MFPLSPPPTKSDIELLVTLWPSFPHFDRFAADSRLSGIRLNSAMIDVPELDHEFKLLKDHPTAVPLYFDIKGKQLRIIEVSWVGRGASLHLELILNHPILVLAKKPSLVLFKAGTDSAELCKVTDGGKRLIFYSGGPRYNG